MRQRRRDLLRGNKKTPRLTVAAERIDIMNIKYESFDFEVNSLDIQYAQLKICEHYDLGRPEHSTGIYELSPNCPQKLKCSTSKGMLTCSVNTAKIRDDLYRVHIDFVELMPKEEI